MYQVIIHDEAELEISLLPDNLKILMVRLIERLELEGNTLRMPHSLPLGEGLFELRVGGRDIARSLYAYADGRKIYVLHAFVKKTQTTPSSAITKARNRLKELLS